MPKNCLVIFVRKPELGKVKTRLARSMGDETALHIYKLLLAHTQNITRNLDIDLELHYTDEIIENDLWSKEVYTKKIQANGDLGTKMSNAISNALATHDKVCIIGSDCAELTSGIIREAFDELDKNDVVLGPANDGGYYLLGMKSFTSDLFENIRWSTEEVLSQTIQAAERHSLSISLLPELIDVDNEEDWNRVKAKFDFPEDASQLIEGHHYYMENGLFVFTALYHLSRGYCCENGCRHCGYR